jgi:hypothetical protein
VEPFLTDEEIVRGFDEWLRQYSENPGAFVKMTALVAEAASQRQLGAPLTYGQECLATLRRMAG